MCEQGQKYECPRCGSELEQTAAENYWICTGWIEKADRDTVCFANYQDDGGKPGIEND